MTERFDLLRITACSVAPAAFLLLATIASADQSPRIQNASPPLVIHEEWRCAITVDTGLNIIDEITVSANEVTARARSRNPEVPTRHFRIIENSDTGLMAVTNDSSQSPVSGSTRTAEIIALDKRNGKYVEADVSLSDKDSPDDPSADAWKLRGTCRQSDSK